jgi:hypothetical protein
LGHRAVDSQDRSSARPTILCVAFTARLLIPTVRGLIVSGALPADSASRIRAARKPLLRRSTLGDAPKPLLERSTLGDEHAEKGARWAAEQRSVSDGYCASSCAAVPVRESVEA